jgi:hypothetical protein
MSITVVGGRFTGKTTTLLELARPSCEGNIRIIGGEQLVSQLHNAQTLKTHSTTATKKHRLKASVRLPITGQSEMEFTWIDTPGEFFSITHHQDLLSTAWQELKQEVSRSSAIVLLIPPYRELLRKNLSYFQNVPRHLMPESIDMEFPTQVQWRRNLGWWFDFLQQTSPRAQHINVLMHKADLFADVEEEGAKWIYRTGGNNKWSSYFRYVRETYFSPAIDLLTPTQGISKNVFITTVQNRSLLELPWLHLSPHDLSRLSPA